MVRISKQLDDKLANWQKILLILYDLTRQSKKFVEYEDIVVNAFQKYPQTFHLRGYKNYPDSSHIHKRLYDMKPRGLIKANQNSFSLTEKGVKTAEQLRVQIAPKVKKDKYKASRDTTREISRIFSSDSFVFFKKNKKEKILDTDFFQYLGVSVHTSRNEFLNRVEVINFLIKEAENFYPEEVTELLLGYHHFMIKEFNEIFQKMSTKKDS